MCLISVCPKGTSKNSEQVHKFITRGAETNKCGSGIMWKINSKKTIHIKKGFFNIQELHDFVTKLNLGLEDELVIHHRTRTQGNTDKENTHPFIISADHATCVALEGEFNLPMLAHNGMFSDLREHEVAGYSDTYAFTKGIMSKKIIMQLLEEEPTLFKKCVADNWGWSKIAVLHPKKDVIMIGDFVKAEDELVAGAFYYHSNGGYKSYLEDKGGSSFDWGEGKQSKATRQRTSTIIPFTSNNNSAISYEPANRKLKNTHLDSKSILISKDNYNDFVILLKPNCHLAGLSKDEAYLILDFGFHTCKVASPQTPHIHQYILMSYINSLFYFIPKKHKEDMYKDYLILINTFDVSKTGIKKLKDQYNRNHKMRTDSRYIVKKLGIPIMKQSIKMFLDKIESEIAPIISIIAREANEVSISD